MSMSMSLKIVLVNSPLYEFSRAISHRYQKLTKILKHGPKKTKE